ncbi:MAG: hypothetical protein ACQEXX_00020 [Bacillota bacterium]
MLSQQRNILIEWTEGFIDRDKKIVKEFQTTFHSCLWEFYLFAVFKENGFLINNTHNRPDFMITSPVLINIEAVISSIKVTGRPESERNLEDTLSALTPPYLQDDFSGYLDEAIIRHSNAIIGKQNKYIESYSKCNWIKENVPFVIALGSYDQVNYGREFYYPMLALLYGWYFNAEHNSYEQKNSIIKIDTCAEIPLGLFFDQKYKDISAIIFSCTVTLGKLTSLAISKGNDVFQTVVNIRHDSDAPHFKFQKVSKLNPEELSDGLFILHNPNAKNKLSLSAFSKTNAVQITYDNGQLIL